MNNKHFKLEAGALRVNICLLCEYVHGQWCMAWRDEWQPKREVNARTDFADAHVRDVGFSE